MVKKCKEEKCNRQPLYAFKNDKPIYCSLHKIDGMINTRSNVCIKEDCDTSASFNFSGEKAKYCNKHKSSDMVNVINKKCKEDNCSITPSYGLEKYNPIYCTKHKKENMFEVDKKICEEDNCLISALYGFEKNKPIFCSQHKKETMINVRNNLCKNETCNKQPSYGIDKPIYCKEHSEKNMIDLRSKFFNCISCNLKYRQSYNKKNQTLCCYCNPTKQIKTKEITIKNLLIKNGYVENIDFKHDKPCNISNECNKYRPDFVFDCNNYFVILEVDEFQHKYYDAQCELTRMNNICFNLGLPCIFIRYNPDASVPIKTKHLILLEKLKKYLNYNITEAIKIEYLFYL